ncbi:hypothetical protein [Paenibacillus odorifer]|uniref:hypothetical protein n=1 Tax=Paenibacillus odorifer TaxID=189426 RepID=UPI0015C2FBB6|nr:hypothetical protein [Paenibacillus odorifer]
MNRPLPKLVFLTDSSEVTPWTRARSSGRHSLGAGSEFSDATPWAGSDSSNAIYNFIGV